MKKEIIIAFSWYGIGGAQRRAVTIANGLINYGYEVSVIAVMGPDGTIKDENYFGLDSRIKIVDIPKYYKDNVRQPAVQKADKFIEKRIYLLKLTQNLLNAVGIKPDYLSYRITTLRKCKEARSFFISHPNSIVLNFGFGIFDRIYLGSIGLKQKIIYAETNAFNKYVLDRFCEFTKKAIKKCDAFVFQTKEQAKEHNLLNNKNSYVIHNPIKQNLPETYKGERRKAIVNFCRLSRQKNLLLLIEAFNEIKDKIIDYNVEIYVDTANVNDLSYYEEILQYIKSNDLEERVRLLPPSSEIHSIINDCAMFVSTSDYEGISNSMIEAMAIGLPCICTDCDGGGAREIIEDSVNGILIPKKDKEALKKAMLKMINDAELRNRCSENAVKIKDSLSVDGIVDEWIKVIESVI